MGRQGISAGDIRIFIYPIITDGSDYKIINNGSLYTDQINKTNIYSRF